jgi:hypothetical protein
MPIFFSSFFSAIWMSFFCAFRVRLRYRQIFRVNNFIVLKTLLSFLIIGYFIPENNLLRGCFESPRRSLIDRNNVAVPGLAVFIGDIQDVASVMQCGDSD